MIVEFLLLLFLIAVCFYENKSDNLLVCIIAVILILNAGLRTSGADYEHYLDMFKHPDYFSNGVEYSYIFLSKRMHTFTELLMLYAAIAVSMKIFVIQKNVLLPNLSILIYYTHFYFLHEMIQSRAGVASGFMFLMLFFVIKKMHKPAFICYLLSVVFHYSFFDKKVYVKLYSMLFFVAILKYILNVSIIDILLGVTSGPLYQRLGAYQFVSSQGSYEEIKIVNFIFFVQIVILCVALCMIFKKKYLLSRFRIYFIKRNYRLLILCTNIYFLGLIIYMLLAEIPAMAFRLSEICFAVEIFLIPYFYYLFKDKFVAKIALSTYSALIFVLYQVILT